MTFREFCEKEATWFDRLICRIFGCRRPKIPTLHVAGHYDSESRREALEFASRRKLCIRCGRWMEAA